MKAITRRVFGTGDGETQASRALATVSTSPEGVVPVVGELPVRRLSIGVLDWLVAKEALQTGWRQKAHVHLDFSSTVVDNGGRTIKIFELTHFQPYDFYWGGPAKLPEGVPERDTFPVAQLETLILDGNRLTDDAFDFRYQNTTSLSGTLFKSLRVLRMKGNMLRYPMMLLPRLRELNLSQNQIARVPPLAGLPLLEVLNLSQNEITKLDKDKFVKGDKGNCPRGLRTINLAANKIETQPSDMFELLCVLRDLQSLTHIVFKDNPFCSYFGEYQSLLVKCVPSLLHVDDISVPHREGGKNNTRAEMLESASEFFGFEIVYDSKETGHTVINSAAQMKEMSSRQISELMSKIHVSCGTMEEAKRYLLKDRIELLDTEIEHRRQLREHKFPPSAQQREAAFKRSQGAGGGQELPMPRMTDFIKELDEALAGHSSVSTSVSLVFQLASRIMGSATERFDMMFEDVGHGKRRAESDSRKIELLRAESVVTFVEQVEMLYERNPDSRLLLIRTLAKFAPVKAYNLGVLCLTTLGSFARGGADGMRQVMDVVKEMILPQIMDKEITDSSCGTIIQGVAKLNTKECSKQLAEALSEHRYVRRLIAFAEKKFKAHGQSESDPNDAARDALAALLHCAAVSKDGAACLLDESELVLSIAYEQICERQSRLKDRNKFELFLNMVGILRKCIAHHPERAVKHLTDPPPKEGRSQADDVTDLHLKLLEQLSKAFEITIQGHRRPIPEELSLAQYKKLAAVMDVLTDLMQDRDILAELAKGEKKKASENKLIDLLVCVFEYDSADPVLLASTLRCIRVLLEDNKSREKYLGIISKYLQLESESNLVLPYIDDRKFKELYKKCEKHLMQTEAETGDEQFFSITTTVPDHKACTNVYAHRTIIAIVDFLNLFSAKASEDKACANISETLNQQRREHLLFQLLEVPSEDVQAAVVKAIGQTDISELEDDEVQQLISLLDPNAVARQETLLCRVVSFLQKLLETPGPFADKFRERHAREVLRRTFEMLARNSDRATYGNEAEEHQKVTLSVQAVSLLVSASQQPLLRRHMRLLEVAGDFCHMLKNEELLVSYACEDICVESTWTGRDVEKLLSCIGGGKAVLSSSRKQAFRVLSRIADVLIGVADPLNQPPLSAQERGRREAKMWNSRDLQWEAGFLDDSVFEDRKNQQQIFIAFSGLSRLMNFLERRAADDASDKPNSGSANGKDEDRVEKGGPDDDRVAKGLQMQKEALKFIAELRRSALEWETVIKEEEAKTKANEDPTVITLDDGEVADPIDHREVLARTFMQMGWETSAEKCGPASPVAAAPLRTQERFMLPGTDGHVGRAYLVAATLRAIYALLVVPTAERCKYETLYQLRDPRMQQRLVMVVDNCESLVDCHVAAKLMAVLTEALAMPAGQGIASGDQYLTSLMIAAAFARRCLLQVSPLLETACGAYVLTLQQQTLCFEAVRLLKVVTHALTCMHVADNLRPATEWSCRQTALQFAVPLVSVRCVFLCLLYDMQVNIGSQHGKSITDKYVRSVLDRQGLREMCSAVLSVMLDACPSMRYDILELFSIYEVRGKHHVRESLVSELLERVHMLKYSAAMEEMLQQRQFPDELILHCIHVELLSEDTRVTGLELAPRTLLTTNKRLLLMARPRHRILGEACGVCPPESFCPIGPEIDREFDYKMLTRIILGPDPQMFALAWRVPRGQAERSDIFMCHKSDQRQAVVEAIGALSGLGCPAAQVEIVQDEVIAQSLMFEMRSTHGPVCVNYAIREFAQPSGHFHLPNAAAAKPNRLSLFVLLESELLEFEVRFEHYVFPVSEFPIIKGSENYLYLELEERDKPAEDPLARLRRVRRGHVVGMTEVEHLLMSPRSPRANNDKELGLLRQMSKRPEKVIAARERAKISTHEQLTNDLQREHKGSEDMKQDGALAALKQARRHILYPLLKAQLANLLSVTFDDGEVPILRLTFASGQDGKVVDVAIRFFDDTAREHWRRGLAFALNRSESGKQWSRLWLMPAERDFEPDDHHPAFKH